MLAYGAETWIKLTEKENKEMNNGNTQYLAKLLRVGTSIQKVPMTIGIGANRALIGYSPTFFQMDCILGWVEEMVAILEMLAGRAFD